MYFLGVLPAQYSTVYDGKRKYKMHKKGQKRDCSATCAVLHLYQKLIERLNPKHPM